MELTTIQISVKGKPTPVLSVMIDGQCVITTGKFLKTARIRDEDYVEGEAVRDPGLFVAELKSSKLPVDIFSFVQPISETKPKFPGLPLEWDNVAAIPLTTYEHWLKNLSQDSRRNVKLAEKRGVKVRVVPFDDALVRGIKEINDEMPVRQGRPFWNYGADLAAVRRENGTYRERADFIAAFFQDELIGYIKVVYVDRAGSIMQIQSKNAHFDKRPANAMVAKAVEVACQKGMQHLLYCKYTYGNKVNCSIREFKRRNGFAQLNYPRYNIPLTLKGKIALKLGIHQGLKNALPPGVLNFLLDTRSKLYEMKFGGGKAGTKQAK
jgi:hypothetical protein